MTEDAVKKEYKFVRDNLALLPYNPKAGIFREGALIDLYNRLKEEGIWPVVFHENTDMTLIEFMNFFSGPGCLLQIMALVDNDKLVDVVGFSWVTDFSTCRGLMTRATGSFAYFMKYQKPMYTDQFGAMILEYWFDVLGVDTVVGVTPENNRAALAYVKRTGFKEYARLPNYTTYNNEVIAGVVTLLTKAEYRQLVGG